MRSQNPYHHLDLPLVLQTSRRLSHLKELVQWNFNIIVLAGKGPALESPAPPSASWDGWSSWTRPTKRSLKPHSIAALQVQFAALPCWKRCFQYCWPPRKGAPEGHAIQPWSGFQTVQRRPPIDSWHTYRLEEKAGRSCEKGPQRDSQFQLTKERPRLPRQLAKPNRSSLTCQGWVAQKLGKSQRKCLPEARQSNYLRRSNKVDSPPCMRSSSNSWSSERTTQVSEPALPSWCESALVRIPHLLRWISSKLHGAASAMSCDAAAALWRLRQASGTAGPRCTRRVQGPTLQWHPLLTACTATTRIWAWTWRAGSDDVLPWEKKKGRHSRVAWPSLFLFIKSFCFLRIILIHKSHQRNLECRKPIEKPPLLFFLHQDFPHC